MCHPAVYVAIAGANIIQARKTRKQEEALATQAYLDRQQQIKENRATVELETLQKGNVLSQQFQERMATMRAILSPSGIGQSNSVDAAIGFNKSQFQRELNVVALNASRQRADLAYKSKESGLQLTADKMRARTRYTKTLFDSTMLATKGAIGMKGLGGGASTGGNIGNVDMSGFGSGPGLYDGGIAGTGGFAPDPITGKYYYGD